MSIDEAVWTPEDESAYQAVRTSVSTIQQYVREDELFTLVPHPIMRLALCNAKALLDVLEEVRDACPPF